MDIDTSPSSSLVLYVADNTTRPGAHALEFRTHIARLVTDHLWPAHDQLAGERLLQGYTWSPQPPLDVALSTHEMLGGLLLVD